MTIKKRKTGRPLAGAKKKGVRLVTSVNESDASIFRRAAEAQDMTLADFIRRTLRLRAAEILTAEIEPQQHE